MGGVLYKLCLSNTCHMSSVIVAKLSTICWVTIVYYRPAVPDILLGKGGSIEATSVVEKTELFLIGCR